LTDANGLPCCTCCRLIDLIYAHDGAAIASANESELSWSLIGSGPSGSAGAGASSLAATQSDVEAQQASSSSSSLVGLVEAIVIRGISDRQLALIQQSEDVDAVLPDLRVRVPDGIAPASMDLLSISAGELWSS
jgi:hypothetical protein